MELVYLWVEDYKNIHREGFNFSPNYDVKFTPFYEDEKLSKKSELKITPKENPLKDFFGDNINVTAIVGENGSGKSSVFECLLSILINNQKINKYLIIVRNKEDELIQYDSLAINVNKITKIEANHNGKIVENYKYTASLFITNQYLDETFLEKIELISEQSDVIRTHKEKKNINIKILENAKKYENVKFIQDSKNFFLPTKIRIKISHIKDLKNLTDKEQKKIKILEKKADEFLNKKEYKNYLKEIYEIYEIFKKSNYYSKGSYISRIIDEDNIYGYNEDLSKRYASLLENFKIKDIRNNIFYEFTISEINGEIINFLRGINNIHIFQIELLDDNKSFDNLSYGEQQLLIQLHLILNHFNSKKIITIDKSTWNEEKQEKDEAQENTNIEKYFVFIDEFELGLHPNWQKKALAYMIDFFKIFDIKIDLFITSHSPFILSDLPKENIIFLEKGKQVYPFENGQTFGANIHTLLSHGFFMKDGLMGEFAKNKISKILNFLNGKNKFIDIPINQIKPTIGIIGEDFLREKFLKMYDERFKVKSKDDEIKELKAEIERLKNAQNRI